MTKNLVYYCVIAIIGLIMAACNHSNGSTYLDEVDMADKALTEGNMEKAISICDRLTHSSDTSDMSWKDYCKVAAIYAIAYDGDYKTDESMAAATICLAKARSMQPDSVNSFIANLPVAQSLALNTVSQTLDGLYADHTDIQDHEEDDFDPQDETTSEVPS